MYNDPLAFQIAFILIYGLAGLCAGSFASAIIFREKSNLSWFAVKGAASRSSCPACGTALVWKDLIPLFSWSFAKGKCRYCSNPIPVFYPLIELTCCLFSLIVFFWSGISIISITFLFCLPFLASIIYLGLFWKKFSPRLVMIVGLIGCIAFVLQLGFH